jgi:hypothetical protein
MARTYKQALAQDKNLPKYILQRDDFPKGSRMYNIVQNKINEAYGVKKRHEVSVTDAEKAIMDAADDKKAKEAKAAADKKAAKKKMLELYQSQPGVKKTKTASSDSKTGGSGMGAQSQRDALKKELQESSADAPKKMTTVKRTKGSFPLREAKKAEREKKKEERKAKPKLKTRLKEKLSKRKNNKAKSNPQANKKADDAIEKATRGMKAGGKIKAYDNGGKVGDREPGQVFVKDGQFYQVNKAGTHNMKMTANQVFRYLDENDALSAPHEGKTSAQSRSFAARGIKESLAKNDMDLMADYVKPGYRGIEGFAVRSAASKGVGPTDYNPSKRSQRRNRN